MASILEADSVIKAFGNRQVLTDIFLTCRTGDILGMLGRNGTGKSTLLRIIFGSLPAQNSFIRIDGKICRQPYKTPGDVAYLPKHHFLPHQLTLWNTVELYLGLTETTFFFEDSLIGGLRANKVSTLSGGELRYLEIKLLLHLPSKFVLLDEPFNGVAPVMVDRLKNLIRQHAVHKGVILTDHDYENVLDVANRYCLLYDGGIKHIESREDLVKWQYLTA
jgi:ABC-type multidrug transport system ATPase subunit